MNSLAQISEPLDALARAEAMNAAWDRAHAALMRRDYAECDRELARFHNPQSTQEAPVAQKAPGNQ